MSRREGMCQSTEPQGFLTLDSFSPFHFKEIMPALVLGVKDRDNTSEGSALPSDVKSARLNSNQYPARQDNNVERGAEKTQKNDGKKNEVNKERGCESEEGADGGRGGCFKL